MTKGQPEVRVTTSASQIPSTLPVVALARFVLAFLDSALFMAASSATDGADDGKLIGVIGDEVRQSQEATRVLCLGITHLILPFRTQ